MMIKTVIFDLDGTITEPFFDFDAIREEMGLSKDSGPILESMKKMAPDQRHRVEAILKSYEDRAVSESVLNEGAGKTLDALRSRGINIGILTRNKRCNAVAIAQKHDLQFDAIVDREDGPVKPDAFGVLKLCKQFDTPPEQSLVVGDYLFDILSAKAAGAIAVLLKTHKDSKDFTKYTDFTITALDQLLEIIDDKASQSKGFENV